MEIEIDEPDAPDQSLAAPDTPDQSLAAPDTPDQTFAAPDTRDQPAPEDRSAVELESIEGIGPAYATRLHEAGVTNVADLETVDPDDLAQESGIGEARIRGWVERARDRENA